MSEKIKGIIYYDVNSEKDLDYIIKNSKISKEKIQNIIKQNEIASIPVPNGNPCSSCGNIYLIPTGTCFTCPICGNAGSCG